QDKRRNLTPDEILEKVHPLVKAALGKKRCRDYISQNGDALLDPDARVSYRRFINKRENYRLINEGVYSGNTIAQAGIDNTAGGVRKPTIRLYKQFFSDSMNITTRSG